MVRLLPQLRKSVLLAGAFVCAIVTGGPFLWVAVLSLRTTPEILKNPYRLARTTALGKIRQSVDLFELRPLLLE